MEREVLEVGGLKIEVTVPLAAPATGMICLDEVKEGSE